jgi:hypothetical protein
MKKINYPLIILLLMLAVVIIDAYLQVGIRALYSLGIPLVIGLICLIIDKWYSLK